MTFPAPLAKSLLMAASIGMVVPVLAQTPRPQRSAPVARNPVPGDTANADKPAENPVQGVEQAWAHGLLGLAVEGNAFVLRFYNQKRQPIAPVAARAAARWDPVNKPGQQRVVLNPTADGLALRSPTLVRPPYVFTAYVTLLTEDGSVLDTVAFDLGSLL